VTVEERLRATTEALSDAMREVRPLSLPSERPGRVSRPRSSRGWPGWLIPLTAAVAVIAVAVALAAVRDGRAASPGPPAPATNPVATAAPQYYVELGPYESAPGYQRDAIVGDTRTGKVLATVKPPADRTFVGVTGAADDRTFVIDAGPDTGSPGKGEAPQGTHTWYLLRLAPGTSHPATLTRLPIAALAESDGIDGLALSPDAGTLAVLYQPGVLAGSPKPYTLRTFSLSTGKALRTWTAPVVPGLTYGLPGLNPDNSVGLAWTADGHTLAFAFPPNDQPDYERTLNVTGKGANLLADSRPVLSIPDNQPNCVSLMLSSDGRTMVCGAVAGRPEGPEFDLYSTATGKLARVLYRCPGSCQGKVAELAWTGAGGTAIGVIEVMPKGQMTIDYTVGLLTPGKFTPLPVRLPATQGFSAAGLAF
jgi:hypothetical protein